MVGSLDVTQRLFRLCIVVTTVHFDMHHGLRYDNIHGFMQIVFLKFCANARFDERFEKQDFFFGGVLTFVNKIALAGSTEWHVIFL